MNEYNGKTDEELVNIIQNGNTTALEYLINKYQGIVKKCSSKFFMFGADENDVEQEGLLGLYFAIKNYKKDNGTTFKTFAKLCIERQLISAIKKANRQKHYLLNNAISINNTFEDDENSSEIINFLETHTSEDPLDIIANTEYYKMLNITINESLSKKELDVLEEFKKGKSYVEIAKKLDCNTKSVDTALTRIRRKAKKIQQEFNKDM